MPVSTKHFDESVKAPRGDEQPAVAFSVIIPVSERCDDLAQIYKAHATVLKELGRPFEFVFVIDSRFAAKANQLVSLEALGEPIRALVLPRDYGEATALAIGFDQAGGEVLVTVPAYFQTEPAAIRDVLKCLESEHDVVTTRRAPRIDPWVNRVQHYVFHFITRWLTGVEFHDLGCGLKGLRRKVIREIQLYGDLHRFLPFLAYQRGFRVAEVPVPQHPLDGHLRVYRPGVYLRRLLDVLTLVFLFKFTKKPLRFFGLIGACLFGSGLLISTFLAVQKLLGLTALSDRPLLILGVLLMVLGIQTGSIGLLGEMIIFTHARKLKDYSIERILR